MTLLIGGLFAPGDDFNDTAVPANSVRPEGLGGSCYAWGYRRGAAYLLFLKNRRRGIVAVIGLRYLV